MSKDDSTGIADAAPASRRRVLQASGGIALAAAVGGGAFLLDESGDGTADAADGASDRVENLLQELSLEQKVGQMTQIEPGSLDPDTEGGLFTEYHVGSILHGGASPPQSDPAALAERTNALQEHAVEETDHGIPFVYGLDAVHGNATVADATAFPHNVGLGAARDPELVRELGRLTGEAIRAMGVHWNFSPTADLNRDPRWGRFYEGHGESPFLAAQLTAATVRGYQNADGDDDTVTAGACVKHFAGYSAPANGNDRSPAFLPTRELRSTFFPPYEAGVVAGAEAVMVNSGSVNGVPAHASEWLLTEILREEWGFDGVVVSDWADFDRMVEMHEYSPDFSDAVRQGINAGVDMYMVPHDVDRFTGTLLDLVESGEVSADRIDEAVRRILTFKENLGLFEDPYVDTDDVAETATAGRDAARRAATESMTLLRNEGDTLPLSPDLGSLLVAGPAGDSVLHQMGGWTRGWQGLSGDDGPAAVTVLDGIEAAVSGSTEVEHRPTGYTWRPFGEDGETFENPGEVREAAADADAAVLVLGEGPYAEGEGDIDTLELHSAQQRLVETVAATDTPAVGVILAGRPRGTEAVLERLDAAVMAYLPGTAAGPAVADVLFGEHNPSGKLPFSWPSSTGQIRNVVDHRPPSNGTGDPGPNEPLFAFGHGLSYASFDYGNLSASASGDDAGGAVEVSVDVTNDGDVAGTEVVHAYVTRAYGSVIHPDERLIGFDRVSLDPGETRTVTVETPLSVLAVVPGDVPGNGERVVETGEYEVTVGGQTDAFVVGERDE